MIGFVGLGEAGLTIAAGLRSEGTSVLGHDVRLERDEALRARASEAGVGTVRDLAGLAAGCDVIVGLTTAHTAVAVAEEFAPLLNPRHVFADWNSGSPGLKRAVADAVGRSGARFVDGAVMGAVPRSRHRVPVLLSGDAEAFVKAVDGSGLNLEVVGHEVGQASAIKMLRSLLVKGMEALVLEFVQGADRYDVIDRVLESMDGALPFEDWSELASYLVTRSFLHAERRAEELRQVAHTLADAGVEPLVAEAGAARLQRLADLDLTQTGQRPSDYTEVVDLIKRRENR